MPTTDQVAALIRAHYKGDEEDFEGFVTQIVADEKQKGHYKAARTLKKAGRRHKHKGQRLNDLSKEESQYFDAFKSDKTLDDLLNNRLVSDLESVLDEHRHREKLLEHGLSPSRKLLLYGPPGTGKTLTGMVLAGELDLPLMQVKTHQIFDSYLGETLSNIEKLFDHIRDREAVYLIDEFDALAIQRVGSQGTNEGRRAVNTLLQKMEHAPPQSLVLGATNEKGIIDHAFGRRFDRIIRYRKPQGNDEYLAAIEHFMKAHDVQPEDDGKVGGELRECLTKTVAANQVELSWLEGLSYADIEKICRVCIKKAILRNNWPVTFFQLKRESRSLDRIEGV